MSKLAIKLVVMLVLVTLVLAVSAIANTMCYQNFANVSTACGGLATGAYAFSIGWVNPLLTIDGDWDTLSQAGVGQSAYEYVNFSKPLSATGSIVQIKEATNTTNVTVPDACWQASSTQVGFRIDSNYNAANVIVNCYNATDLMTMQVLTSAQGRLYESAMWWNMSDPPALVATTFVNGSRYYNQRPTNITAQFNYSGTISSLNVTIDNVTHDYVVIPNASYSYNFTKDLSSSNTIGIHRMKITVNSPIASLSKSFKYVYYTWGGVVATGDAIRSETQSQTSTYFVNLNGTPQGNYTIGFKWDNTTSEFVTFTPGFAQVDTFHFQTNFYTPSVNEDRTVANVWTLSMNRLDGSNQNDTVSTSLSQDVYHIALTNCTNLSDSSVDVATFYVYNEELPVTPIRTPNLNGTTAEFDVNFYYSNASFFKNFHQTYANSTNFRLCMIYSQSNNVTADIYIKYYRYPGETERYYLLNQFLNAGESQEWNIYNFNDTSTLSELDVTTRQEKNFNYMGDVIGKLQRFFVGEGVWRTVQIDKSDSSTGLLHFYVHELTTDYRILFTDTDNHVLKQTDIMKLSCTSGICSITVILSPFSQSTQPITISISHSYNVQSSTLTTNFTDNYGLDDTINMVLVKHASDGDFVICNITTFGSSGYLTCPTGGHIGIADYKSYSNGVQVEQDLVTLNASSLSQSLGAGEGVVWSVGIIVVALGAGLFSPVAAVITVFIGLLAVFLLGIFTPITITFIIIFACVGIFIGFKLRS